MRTRFFLVLMALGAGPAAASTLAAGCGDTVRVDDDGNLDDKDGSADHRDGQGGSGAGKTDGGHDALPDYVDPGCPDASPPMYDFKCDPYNQFDGECMPGEGCYIYVTYPPEPCASEVYGSFCAPVGPGQQGDACGGGFDCGAGFVCVVTGSGNQCVALCALSGEDGCPAGLVCEPIDVEGFGGCL